MTDVDVAIVGGGPGGLATACAILKTSPNLRVKVFERARRLRKVGFVLGMMDNGLNSLEAIDEDLSSNVMQHMLYDGLVVKYDNSGDEIECHPSIESMGFSSKEKKAGFLPWYTLQAELADWLPEGCIALNSAFLSLRQDGSEVSLTLDKREEGEQVVSAKVVVGVDGNQSLVRQSILGDGPPKSMNVVIWRGQSLIPGNWEYDANLMTGWMARGQLFTFVKMLDGKLAWQAFAPAGPDILEMLSNTRYHGVESAQDSTTTACKLQRVLERYEGWPDVVTHVLQTTDLTTITEHGQYFREASQCVKWGEGRVTLGGDAAHLFTPFLGQGVNQALEDAVELGRSIGEYGPTEAALRHYEETRMETALKVQKASVEIGKLVSSGKPLDEVRWMREHPEVLLHRPARLQANI